MKHSALLIYILMANKLFIAFSCRYVTDRCKLTLFADNEVNEIATVILCLLYVFIGIAINVKIIKVFFEFTYGKQTPR